MIWTFEHLVKRELEEMKFYILLGVEDMLLMKDID